jgi:hypothetical protein
MLETYLINNKRNIEIFFSGVAFSASCHGVSIYFESDKRRGIAHDIILNNYQEEEE